MSRYPKHNTSSRFTKSSGGVILNQRRPDASFICSAGDLEKEGWTKGRETWSSNTYKWRAYFEKSKVSQNENRILGHMVRFYLIYKLFHFRIIKKNSYN